MARFRGFRQIGGGGKIGAMRQIVYSCNGCGYQVGTKPAQCPGCGRMDFARFDSRAEIRRNGELELMLKAGLISLLRRQPRYELLAYHVDIDGKASPVKVGEYVADWSYMRDGALVVEDAKGGAITAEAAWKLRHFKAQFGFDVKLTQR